MDNPGSIGLVMLVFLGLSFFLSGMEAGVFALSRLRIRKLMRAGNPHARVLHGYLENPENFLWTILVGNTLANFLVVGLIVLLLHLALASYPALFWIALLGAVFLFYATCDLLPKTLFRAYPNRLCMIAVRPFRLLHILLAPLVSLPAWLSRFLLRWTGDRIFTGRLFGSREEFRHVMQDSAESFTSEERAMINRILELQSLTVGQVSRPLDTAVTVTAETPLREALQISRERNLTRFPVWQTAGGRRRIIGILSLKSLLYAPDLDPDRAVAGHVQPALFLYEGMRIEEALRRIQRGGQRLAIVLGRNHRETGFICLQDIFRVAFGEVNP